VRRASFAPRDPSRTPAAKDFAEEGRPVEIGQPPRLGAPDRPGERRDKIDGLAISELFLKRGNLSGVASESLLERLCAQFCQALFCLGILFRENHLVLEPGLHLLARLQRRCFDLLLKARGKRLDLVLEPRQLLLLLQGRIANCLVFSKASCCSRFFPRTQLLIVLVLRLLFSRFFRYS